MAMHRKVASTDTGAFPDLPPSVHPRSQGGQGTVAEEDNAVSRKRSFPWKGRKGRVSAGELMKRDTATSAGPAFVFFFGPFGVITESYGELLLFFGRCHKQ
ncbi:hypothetical protein GW17_00027763 [Ensete ventricosum]|nr:hypothetical protein GW17_00027763 [Ensete ventricosum]